MILQDYVRLVRRGAWLLVALVAAGAAGGFAFSASTPPTYFARATVLISAQGDDSPAGLAQSSAFAIQRASTYAGLGTSSVVLERAAAALGQDTTAEDLTDVVNVTSRTASALIDVDAEAATGAGAADRANAVASALAAEAPALDSPGSAASVVLSTVQVAPVPAVADSPRPRNNVVTGAVVGLALGVLGLALWHALDDRMRSPADIPRSRTLRVLSVLPRASRRGREEEERSEELRRLRAVLTAVSGGASTVVVAAVSASAAADAGDVVVGLARAISETGASVLVVDLTGASQPLGTRGDGLPAGALGGDQRRHGSAEQQLVPVVDRQDLAWLMPSDLGATSAELIGAVDSGRALDEVAGHYTHRLLLCPPALTRSEASIASARASTTVLVADAGRTSRSALQRAAGALLAAQAPHVGVVLVGARRDETWHG